MSLLPANTTADVRRLLLTRALRGLADGVVAVVLASYLTGLGFSPLRVGAIITGTLLGSAALTLAVGLGGHRLSRRRLLLGSSALMLATGIGFAGLTSFWPLLVIAIAGTINPSAGDVSLFLPVEQAMLSGLTSAQDRTRLFAWYNLSGTLAGAVGALLSAVPAILARRWGWELHGAERAIFVFYAAIAVVSASVYSGLTPAVEQSAALPARALSRSRPVVLRLAALFSLDAMGGGFVVQSLLVLWLHRRFDLSLETTGTLFFVAGLLSAFSQLVSSRLAARIGLVETMVFTHLPANVFLILAGIMPTAPLAIAFLLLRMALSQMDVPARQSYVMSVVPPEERAAAASVTNVPRSLASAATPLLAGVMLEHSSFGWPLLCAGAIKVVYDLLLLVQFRAVRSAPHLEPPR